MENQMAGVWQIGIESLDEWSVFAFISVHDNFWSRVILTVFIRKFKMHLNFSEWVPLPSWLSKSLGDFWPVLHTIFPIFYIKENRPFDIAFLDENVDL